MPAQSTDYAWESIVYSHLALWATHPISIAGHAKPRILNRKKINDYNWEKKREEEYQVKYVTKGEEFV